MEQRGPAVPSPKDGNVNEEMQMEVSVTRVGKWGERVVSIGQMRKIYVLRAGALWQIPRQLDMGRRRDSRTSTEFSLWGNRGFWGFLADRGA